MEQSLKSPRVVGGIALNSNRSKQKEDTIMTKEKVTSLIIKAIYFPKEKSDLHFNLQKVLNPDYALFYERDESKPENASLRKDNKSLKLISRIQNASNLTAFDYRIYEELKEMKKAYRQD